jgi:hypothetical protein
MIGLRDHSQEQANVGQENRQEIRRKKPAAKAAAVKGYKGHRAGSAKEKIHMLYDKHGPEKARPMAEKLLAASTVMTSFSQFKKVAGRKA